MVRHCAINGGAETNEILLAIEIFIVMQRAEIGNYIVRNQGGKEVNT